VTLDRLFTTPDFQEDFFGPARWLPGSTTGAYTTLEPASGASGGGTDIVRYEWGHRHSRAHRAGLEACAARRDGSARDRELCLLARPESRDHLHELPPGVAAAHTGDFWLLDLGTWALRKLGGPDAPPSTLMFAKFSAGRPTRGVRAGAQPVRRGRGNPEDHAAHERRIATLINGTF